MADIEAMLYEAKVAKKYKVFLVVILHQAAATTLSEKQHQIIKKNMAMMLRKL